MNSRNAKGTIGVYRQTLTKMEQYDPKLTSRTFEEINREWLTGFERFLAETAKSANARAIHLRNIRAVFNDAIDDEITTAYPFRKFKIKTQRTRKRALTVEDLRTLMKHECEEYQHIYRDMFLLMFYL